MKSSSLLLLASALLLTACASSPQVDPGLLSAASSRGVNSGTVLKMQSGRALDVQDIENLTSRGVPSNVIIAYLNSTRKVYNLSGAELAGLKSEGATPQLLNYLQESEGFYGSASAAPKTASARMQKDRYYNSPYYQDEQPFAYNPPVIDDWYDSAYEESLYSPFSFN